MNFASWFIIPRFHVALLACCMLIAGITAAHLLPFVYLAAVLATLAIVLLSSAYWHQRWLVSVALVVALLAGAGRYLQVRSRFNQTHASLHKRKLTLQATIDSIDKLDHARYGYAIVCSVRHVIDAQTQQALNVRPSFCLYTRRKPDNLQVADCIELKDITLSTPGDSPFSLYLYKQGHIGTLFMPMFCHTLIERPAWSLARAIAHQKQLIFDRLRSTMDRPTFALFSTIFLGYKAPVKRTIEQYKSKFKQWGISHYLARSGLHLVIFIMIWHLVLNFLPVGYGSAQVLLMLLVLLYALLTWSSVSFERALYMFLIYRCFTIAAIAADYVQVLVLTTFVVLLLNPLHLLFLDFQLSFGLTFALAWFTFIKGYKRRLLMANT